MTFKHKLSRRLALLRDRRIAGSAVVLGVAAVLACEKPLNLTDPGTSAVSRLVLSPKVFTLRQNQTVAFTAVGLTGTGDTANVAVSWSVTSGSITDTSTNNGKHYGRYKPGSDTGKVKVVAKGNPGGVSDTATVTVTPAPVASVTVTPATVSMLVGAAAPLTAITLDSAGNVLSGRATAWSTSNPAVASVSGSGLVTGVVAGSATITATSEGQSGTAAISVTAPVTNPGTVADLAVAGVTDNSVTLSFTEVTDGTGQPASYDIRLAVGAISWSSAADVTRGTCTPPVVGSVIGAKRTCTVLGLAAATGYQFQLVAFRGTLNVNAVFGLLSNVASGTTAASTAPVAAVTVSPAAASVPVGQTLPLTATPKDASGQPLSGRVVTWATSNATLASVSSAGLVTGIVAGTATITATSEGQSGTAAITVSAPAGGGTVLFQEAFEDNAFAARGWYDNTTMATTTTQHIAGSTRALEVHFLAGATTPTWGGSARHLFPATPTLYVSYWVKYSTNWVGSGQPYHPHEFLVLSDQDGDWDGPSNNWLTMYIEHNYQNGGIPRLALQDNKAINTSYGTPPINLTAITENRSTGGCNGVVEPNVVATCFNMPPWYNDKELQAAQPAFQPTPGPGYKGDWNHVEVYFQINSIVGGVGRADGVMQYWFNGVLVIDRHDILFRMGARPSINFHQFLIAPS